MIKIVINTDWWMIMMKKHVKPNVYFTTVFFVLSLILFLLIGSPYPILGSVIVAFLVFELRFLFFFVKEKKKDKVLS